MANYQEFIDIRTGHIFEFDLDNTVAKFEYTFVDGPEDVPDFTPVKYPFEYRVIKLNNDGGYIILIRHWLNVGQVIGCGDCAMTQVNSVWHFDDTSFEDANRDMDSFADMHTFKYGSDEQKKDLKISNFFIPLDEVTIPVKVQEHFVSELRKAGLLNFKVERIE